MAVDVLEHQWQTFSVLEIKVLNGDVPLVRPVIWRTIIWVDPCGLTRINENNLRPNILEVGPERESQAHKGKKKKKEERKEKRKRKERKRNES